MILCVCLNVSFEFYDLISILLSTEAQSQQLEKTSCFLLQIFSVNSFGDIIINVLCKISFIWSE